MPDSELAQRAAPPSRCRRRRSVPSTGRLPLPESDGLHRPGAAAGRRPRFPSVRRDSLQSERRQTGKRATANHLGLAAGSGGAQMRVPHGHEGGWAGAASESACKPEPDGAASRSECGDPASPQCTSLSKAPCCSPTPRLLRVPPSPSLPSPGPLLNPSMRFLAFLVPRRGTPPRRKPARKPRR